MTFPLNADNNPGQKALEYFEEACKNHGPDRAEEMLERAFPWIDDVRDAARADNNRHPDHKKAQEFLRGLNYLKRTYERFEEEVGGTEQEESPGPTALIESWFAENNVLRATFEELAHFTGFTPGSFGYPIRKLEGQGYRFVRDGSGLRVAERPSDKEDMIDEALEILDRLPQSVLEHVLAVLHSNYDEDYK